MPRFKLETFVNGWYTGAVRVDAHPDRVGDAIEPFAVVLHTTDMAPNTHDALVRAWSKTPGKGNGAHFLIAADGRITQFVPINKNANHAGGPEHGWFLDGSKKRIHPNRATVGIEIHNAGQLRKIDGAWYHVDGVKKTKIDSVVETGKSAWHAPTDSQTAALGNLLTALDSVLAKCPEGLHLQSNGKAPEWAFVTDYRHLGHVTLDPNRKSDPGPILMAWLRSN